MEWPIKCTPAHRRAIESNSMNSIRTPPPTAIVFCTDSLYKYDTQTWQWPAVSRAMHEACDNDLYPALLPRPLLGTRRRPAIDIVHPAKYPLSCFHSRRGPVRFASTTVQTRQPNYRITDLSYQPNLHGGVAWRRFLFPLSFFVNEIYE